MKTPILEMKHIRKTFASTIALGDVSFDVYPGEIRGLIGENGSGKSTVCSIAAGMQKADSGQMFFHGKLWQPVSTLDALEHGVGMIVQESGTISGITVAENLFLGEIQPFCGKLGAVNRKALYAAADQVLEDLGIKDIRGEFPLGSLDFQARKLVEIAKVARKDPEILVVDETTTALSQHGRTLLYDLVKRYRDMGKAVLFISHDLEEIMEVCDTLTVLRDGAIIRHFDKAEFDADQIRTSMIGRQLQGDYYRSDFDGSFSPEIALEAKGICWGTALKNVDLELHKGEILGIGGLSHCGMHPLGKILFGALEPDAGTVTANGTAITSESVAMKERLGYVSKDRDTESLCLTASIQDNIAIGGLEQFTVKKFLLFPKMEKAYVDRQIEALSVKCAGREQQVSQLSGGNKQKVVFGKWIGRESQVLILDCPTRGVDIGVKRAMYQLMADLKKQGKSIVMISEELPELIGMCDRLIILKDGQISHTFERSPELTDAQIIGYMI